MPTFFCYGYGGRARRFCERAYRWSTGRGGCRFEAGHQGACKPGRYR